VPDHEPGAVATGEIGAAKLVVDDPQRGYAGGQQRRLSVDGVSKFVLGSIETEIAERETQRMVSLFQGFTRDGVGVGQRFCHADALAALSGEKKGGGVRSADKGEFCHGASSIEWVGRSQRPRTKRSSIANRGLGGCLNPLSVVIIN